MSSSGSAPVGPGARVWVFDVDGCLVDSMTGMSLRPGAREALGHLRAGGHSLLLWSAGGATYARQRAAQHGIDHLFDAFYGKDERDGGGYYVVAHLHPDVSRLIFVDDRIDDIPPTCHRWAVLPYIAGDPADREMLRFNQTLP